VSATVGAVAVNGAIADAAEAIDAAQAALRSARAGDLGTRERSRGPRRRGDGGGSRERVRAAMEGDEFWLLYQPIASMDDRKVRGVEAVLHWSDPRRGVLHLDEVRDELDRSGLEAEVAWWMLAQVAGQAAAWAREHPELELVVNTVLPTSLLCSDDLADRVDRLLGELDLPPSQLCIEVAGRDRHDLERTGTVLRELKGLGLQLGLDAFGTSWSSLSYLRRTAPDVVKIPARFVDGLGARREDEAVVQQLVGMATALGVVAIAEGVSRPEHPDLLRSMGCDLGQGPLLGAPQPAESVEVLLRRGRVELSGSRPAR
jgi:EAL domain-containing protein (putative c-di-GMP-specific phosphodiesterase class I)